RKTGRPARHTQVDGAHAALGELRDELVASDLIDLHRLVHARIHHVEVPNDVRFICDTLAQKGKRAWIVGGCVRDALLGRQVNDWDVATDARPEEVVKIFARTIPTGMKHGTVTVLVGNKPYEVTTLRGEGAYSDGRRPDSVEFVDDITADLARRDFTVNAIAFDPSTGHLIDPFGGQQDLKNKKLR